MTKHSIFDTQALEAFRKEHKLQPYRIRQIYKEIFHNFVIDFKEMTALSKDLRNKLEESFEIISLEVEDVIEDDETSKFLFKTADGNVMESVLMYHFHTEQRTLEKKLNRITLCISSQVGCNVGCIFCVTWKMGLKKNLTREEILSQVVYANNYVKNKYGKKVDNTWYSIRNVVFMGMGEPMLNYPAVKKVCWFLTDTNYFGLSRKRVTISTSWVLPPLKQFLADDLPVSLAFSLHSADQKLREELVPTIAKYYTIEKLFAALDEYTDKTGNKIFYEYVMIKDKNDSRELAHTCGKLLQGRPAHLNLIPYNQNPAIDLEESTEARIKKFKDVVESYGVPVTVRQNMGRKAKSACGQLGYEKVQGKIIQKPCVDPNCDCKKC